MKKNGYIYVEMKVFENLFLDNLSIYHKVY